MERIQAPPEAAQASLKLFGTVDPRDATNATTAATNKLARHTCKVTKFTSPKLSRKENPTYDDESIEYSLEVVDGACSSLACLSNMVKALFRAFCEIKGGAADNDFGRVGKTFAPFANRGG